MLAPLVIGLEGLVLNQNDRKRLQSKAVGGVILFTRNYESPLQLKALTAEIKNQNPNLTIMVDQEGGRVMRFREGFSDIPPAKHFGDLISQDGLTVASLEAEKFGKLMAQELLVCGVDCSLSPVVDLGINQAIIGTRAFHQDPELVEILARSWIHGMHQAGMKSVLKHFPGHGSVSGDTHVSYLKDSRELSVIRETDLRPFVALRDVADAVMVNHVVYPRIDDLPASFSKVWIKKILREELQFKGLIISDDLGMQAAKLFKSGEEPVRLALEAGCDLVLLCNEFDVMDEVLSSKSFKF